MSKILHSIAGGISALLYFINTIFWVIPVLILSLLKLIPIGFWRTFLSRLLDGCATNWITINNINQRIFSRSAIEVTGLQGLSTKEWYLVISNHQSWVDILALQRVFNREIPFLKFFLKKELIYVPFIGLAWWALDFPFMRRYNKSFLAKNPHLKGKDLETTKKACEKFRYKPVSIMNFVEGTRITPHKAKHSKFNNLLVPKAGGIAFVLSAMGERLTKLVDVTIYYPDGIPTYWDFVCGRVKRINVNISTIEMSEVLHPDVFGDDVLTDSKQRATFQQWLNVKWSEKDALLNKLSQPQKTTPEHTDMQLSHDK